MLLFGGGMRKKAEALEGLRVLREGPVNEIGQLPLDDGTVIVDLESRKLGKRWRFRVRDLYGPNEEVVDVDTGKPIDA